MRNAWLNAVLLTAALIVCDVAAQSASPTDCAALGDPNVTSIVMMNGAFRAGWVIDTAKKRIRLSLRATDTALPPTWIGFGISESGAMQGSDIVTVTSNGIVDDRYVLFTLFPTIDKNKNDWTLECFSSQANTLTLTAIVSRDLDTGDPTEDRAIQAGQQPIIAAYGRSVGGVTYHGSLRDSTLVDFFATSPSVFTVPADVTGYTDAGFTSWSLQPITTQYICQVVDMGSSDKHALAILPTYVNTPGKPYVHHMIVHACGNNLTDIETKLSITPGRPWPCKGRAIGDTGISPLGSSPCTVLVWAEAKGGDPIVMPPEASFPLPRYVVIEAHLNNPNKDTQNITNLARIYTTQKGRRYNATTLLIGDAQVGLPAMAPGKIYSYETSCTPTCTRSFGGPISVFSSFLHMHTFGQRIWTSRIRNGMTEVMDYREFWDQDFQTIVPKNFTIEPGDRLNTHCVYDTTKATKTVTFGVATEQEMCMNFLIYYPAENAGTFCSWVTGYGYNGTLCGGGFRERNIFFPEKNPDPDGAVLRPSRTVPFGGCDKGVFGPYCESQCPTCQNGSSCSEGVKGNGSCIGSAAPTATTAPGKNGKGGFVLLMFIAAGVGVGCILIWLVLLYVKSRRDEATKNNKEAIEKVGLVELLDAKAEDF